MEDFGWLVFVAIFWIMSTVGEMRKAKRKSRQREVEPMTPPRPRQRRQPRQSRESVGQTGPQAGRRELGRDLDEAARRAEDALRRWEARQRAQVEAANAPSPAPAPSRRPAAPARRSAPPPRRETPPSRREAYEAIAGMLAGSESEAALPTAHKPPAEHAVWDNTARHKHHDLPPPARVAPAEEAGGLARLDRLPALQRAILLSEILGRPKALRPGPDLL